MVDLAVERGGNVEGAQARRSRRRERRRRSSAISTCRAGSPASSSALYAKNLLTFLETLIDKKEKTLAINWDDEIVKGTALTRDGAVVHPNFQPKRPAKERPHMDHVDPFVFQFSIFVLAVFVGYYVVWSRDARPAHAADVGDQRDLLGDRGRRAARGRRRRSTDSGSMFARALGFVALDLRLGQHLRRLPGHAAHAGDVPEEGKTK